VNQTIYKYRLKLDDEVVLEMPRDAIVIKVAEQYGHLCLWAEVDSDAKATDLRTFLIAGTGRPLPRHVKIHVGTVVMPGGNLVVHVYELLGKQS
jgi:hypothetical protein